MKKLFFSALIALFLVCVAFGQKTNTEIYNIIKMSKEYNAQNNGIVNPDKIWPGQMLTFIFEDGTEHPIVVEKGDNQWTIVRDKLNKLENEHGQIVAPDTGKINPPKKISTPVESETKKENWWWLLLFLPVIFLLWLAIRNERFRNFMNRPVSEIFPKRNADPVTAGSPQVPGGVNDSGAHNRMRELASNRYPGARLDIRNIRRGRLTGLATVHYADGKPKKLRLNGTPAYAGEVVVNSQTETIYFLQGCGNDARQGNFMSGNDLVFQPDVVVNEDGSESPLSAEKIGPVSEEPKPVVNLGSETHQQRMKVLSIIEAEVAKGEVHEVILDINPDNFGAHIKYKFVAKKTAAEKKEEK